jgi:hypothetical protein
VGGRCLRLPLGNGNGNGNMHMHVPFRCYIYIEYPTVPILDAKIPGGDWRVFVLVFVLVVFFFFKRHCSLL